MNAEWRDQDESRQLFKMIRERILNLEKGLGRYRRTLDFDSADRTAMQTAFDSGIIQGLLEVLEECEIQAG